MGLSDLKAIANDYNNFYFGQSDKSLAKTVLNLLIDTLEIDNTKIDELDTKIDALEARIETLEG